MTGWLVHIQHLVEREMVRFFELLSEHLLQCQFVNHKSHMTWPGIEPWLPQWEAGDMYEPTASWQRAKPHRRPYQAKPGSAEPGSWRPTHGRVWLIGTRAGLTSQTRTCMGTFTVHCKLINFVFHIFLFLFLKCPQVSRLILFRLSPFIWLRVLQ
jgi:hypothetical protein